MAHANDNLKARLRLLHSWREKAKQMAADARGKKGPPRAYFIAQASEAEHYIQRVRDGERPYLDELGQRLRELLGQGDTLIARREAGRISEQDTVLVNQQLQIKVERMRDEIGALNEILGAANSEELGGFIDLEVEVYAQRLGVETAKPPSVWAISQKELVYSGIALVLLAGALFLYWSNLPTGFEISARIIPPPSPQFELQVRNRSDLICFFQVTPRFEANSDGESVQLVMFAHEKSGASKAVPPAARAWVYQGEALDTRRPVQVPPTVNAVFHAKLNQLQLDLDTLEAIEVRGVMQDGDVLFSATAEVLRETTAE